MGHSLEMRSRVHPKYKTKYRVDNWAEYDRALAQRGDITLWISDDAIASWKPVPTGRRGAQRKFSDHAIEAVLTLRLIFNLPLRQAEGFLRSVLSLMALDLEAPDDTTPPGVVRASSSICIEPQATSPFVSSSTAQGYRLWAEESGPPPSMEHAANAAGRSFTSVLTERA
jgi:hypothetical protein